MYKIINQEKIYSKETAKYFNEVITDYCNGCYRSAIVMLYSVVICDLLFKLQEMASFYNDDKSIKILKELERIENTTDFEKELLDKVFNNTKLLDIKTKAVIDNLRNFRNISAHPSLNLNYELIMPTQEETCSLITSILNGILVKPPFFTKRILDFMTDDLDDKYDVFINDEIVLINYVKNKYIGRMDETTIKDLIKGFWKFCFTIADDEKCKKNRIINRRVLSCLINSLPDYKKYILEEQNEYFSNVSNDNNCLNNLCRLLSDFPELYKIFDDATKNLMLNSIDGQPDFKLISWYTSDGIDIHLQKDEIVHTKDDYGFPALMYVKKKSLNLGIFDKYLDFCISYFEDSSSYKSAVYRFDNCLKDITEYLSVTQLKKLLTLCEDNNQIYNNYEFVNFVNYIVTNCEKNNLKLIDFANYEKVNAVINESEEPQDCNYFDDIPFY